MRATTAVAVSLVLFYAAFARPDSPAGAADYLDGLTALEHVKYDDAVASMGKAVDADEDNPDYRIGRAVALIFSEKPADARSDLDRAMKLRPGDRSARMWMATAVAMQGDFRGDSEIYPVAIRGDQFESAVRQMSRNYGQYAFSQALASREGGSAVDDGAKTKMAQARAQFPKLAQEFAARAESAQQGDGSSLTGVLRDRALARVQQRDYANGLTDLDRLLNSTPDDPLLLNAHAKCLLALGCPAIARIESTRVLIHDINNVDAYATRAIAAAKMGDSRRADGDIKIIAEIDPSKSQDVQEAVSAAIAEMPAGFSGIELVRRVGELHQMATDHKPWDAVVAVAISINKGENAVRRRFDEDYQERLRVLTVAAQRGPTNAEAQAELGEFLYQGAIGVRGEVVEPRAIYQSYRWLTDQGQAAEITRASQSLDAALNLDSQNMRAITAKAELLIHEGQWNDAETLLRQALASRPSDPRLLKLFSNVMYFAAAMHNQKAQRLRSPTSWEDAMYIYTRSPSQSELDEADRYEEQAKELWDIANKSMQAAADALKGTADGFEYASVIDCRKDDIDAAISDLQEAIKLAPDRVDFHEALADLYDKKQMRDPSVDQRTIAVNLLHTTAAPMLRVAWLQIPMTQFKAARATLNRAIALDPADPRSAAYLGMIASDDNKPDEALAWWLVASAQDEAQARFEGRSPTQSAIGALAPSRVSFGIAVDLKAAAVYLKQKQAEPAIDILHQAIAAGLRVPAENFYDEEPSSMLPDSNMTPTATVAPPAHSVATMMAWAHYYLGQAMSLQGKGDDSIAEYRIVVGYLDNVPHTVDPGSEIRTPVGYAVYAIGRDAMKHHDSRAALAVMSRYGVPPGASNEFRAAFEKLRDEAQMAASVPTGPILR